MWVLTCPGFSRQIKHAKVDNKVLHVDSTVLYNYRISYILSHVILRAIYWSPARCSHLPPSHLPCHPALALRDQSLDHITVLPAVRILVCVCKRKTPTGDKGIGGEGGQWRWSPAPSPSWLSMTICASPKEVTSSVQRPTSTPLNGKQTTPKG